MKEHTSEEIKNRLSNIGEAIGTIALEYIVELELENEQLKAQIEKMRCCQNCKKMGYNSSFAPICKVMNNSKIENPLGIKCDKWELADE